MVSNLPWMFQTHIADAKIAQFRAALETIAGLDLSIMAHEQAFTTLREVIATARVTLEREGLAGTVWEWVAESKAGPFTAW